VSAPEKKAGPSAAEYRIPSSSGWAGAWKIALGIGILGLGGAGAGYTMDPKRFAFSYLFAFFVGLTLAFGSMFFILVERLTAASWSVTVRRTAEFFAWGIWVFALLFVPVLFSMGTLYPWMSGHAEPSLESEAHAQEAPAAPGAAPAAPATPPAGAVPGNEPASPHGVRPGHMVPGGGPAGVHGMNPHANPGAPAVGGGRGPLRVENREDPEELADAETLAKKAPWLNKVGWLARAALYFAVWIGIAFTFFQLSTSQDGTKDPDLTVRAQRYAPAATFLFGFTLTGAAFDWLMSLLPTWYSTIFGVTIFAGSVVCMYATLIVVTQSLRDAGHIKNAVNVEHYHDLGKLLFGFLIFWAYTSFAQFMLIWYASIPEETTFFHHRWDMGTWMWVSLGIVILHFVVPFFILLSRNVKRRLWALKIGALWLIAMHVVEMYWQVLPYYGGGESTVHWIDAACLVGVAGVYLAAVFYRMTQYPLIPIGDPRLSRAMSFENA
jgi:hypothetical protein